MTGSVESHLGGVRSVNSRLPPRHIPMGFGNHLGSLMHRFQGDQLEIHDLSTRVGSLSSPSLSNPGLLLMKVDVTYDALLRALIEAIRNERDQGKALIGLLSRLMDEASQQGRFANGAGQMKKKRATVRRAKPAGTAKAPSRKARPAAKSAAARKASGSTQATKKRATAKRAKPAATPKSAKARPMTKSTAARKANGSAQATKKGTPARMTKSATPKSASRTKARPMTKSATARKANGMAQATKKRMTSRMAKPASAPKSTPKAKLTAKTAPARKPASPGKARPKPVTASLAKPASTPKPMPVAKAQPVAKPAPVGGPANGLGQTSRGPEAPASAT